MSEEKQDDFLDADAAPEKVEAVEEKPEPVKSGYVFAGRVRHDDKIYEAGSDASGFGDDTIANWLKNGVVKPA